MFIPKEYELTDHAEMLAFMRRYNFAVIINSEDNIPLATHLPFHIMERDGKIVLTAHFARANQQWKIAAQSKTLVVFSQPHAYISPQHYDKEQNVPTWNYVAVHAYGNCTIIDNEAAGMAILEQMILQSEPTYKEQWDKLDIKYKTGLYKGIVPVEIEVTEIKATTKLSQNKTTPEKQRIIAALENSSESTERDIAGYMRENEHKQQIMPDSTTAAEM